MMEKFKINFDSQEIESLRQRISQSRIPQSAAGGDWTLGTPSEYLREVLDAWKAFDPKTLEDRLNRYDQYRCRIDGCDIHFFYIKSPCSDAVPVLMAHGWPDGFLRYVKTFDLLRRYDLIVPSMPGYGYSPLSPAGFTDNASTAVLWHRLMTEVLGYDRYVATGGDMGRGVLFYLASEHPDEIMGLHLTDVGFVKEIATAPDSTLSPDYLRYKRDAAEWMRREGAYINIQSTKPHSLGYGLSDSPAGLAGWLVEKYHDWSDPSCLSMDDILDSLTIYWMTGCAASFITAYYGNAFRLPPLGAVNVPVGIARFPRDILPAPEKWIKEHYNVLRFSDMPCGGHFTAMEAPEAFADDLKAFISSLI